MLLAFEPGLQALMTVGTNSLVEMCIEASTSAVLSIVVPLALVELGIHGISVVLLPRESVFNCK
jgi:hypothetical protein